jgi:CBS domain-containing protein
MTTEPTAFAGRVAADLMLREPKTLPGGATVAEVRAVLANPKVQMVLLADGTTFRGAVTEIPDTAPDAGPAVAHADPDPETIAPDESGELAFRRAAASPHRRVIVLDDDRLLGLLCLNAGRTGFCQTPGSTL